MPMTTDGLLPCPRCKSPAHVWPVDIMADDRDFHRFHAVCGDAKCLVNGPIRKTELEATGAWNELYMVAVRVIRQRDRMALSKALQALNLSVEDCGKLSRALESANEEAWAMEDIPALARKE
jgi:hypothetical protein